jgi:hypothetical protein
MIKNILLLTKSSKRKNDGKRFGNCVAGIDEDTMKFIRLVFDENGDSLSDDEMPFEPLDIIQCEIDGPYPIGNQVENHIVDLSTVEKIGNRNIEFIKRLYEENKFQKKSFFGDMNDRIADIKVLNYSLSAVIVKNLTIYRDGNFKHRADFTIDDNKASNISMTDPYYYQFAKNATKNNPFLIDNAIIIVSLPSDQPYFKFIAKIFAI